MSLHPEQITSYKKMRPAQKLLIAAELWHLARELKRNGLKQQHPEWSEEQIETKVREIFLYART